MIAMAPDRPLLRLSDFTETLENEGDHPVDA